MGARLSSGTWAVTADLVGDLPTSVSAPGGGRVESQLWAGEIGPCFARGWLAACGVFALGQRRSRGREVELPSDDTGLYAAAGDRMRQSQSGPFPGAGGRR